MRRGFLLSTHPQASGSKQQGPSLSSQKQQRQGTLRRGFLLPIAPQASGSEQKEPRLSSQQQRQGTFRRGFLLPTASKASSPERLDTSPFDRQETWGAWTRHARRMTMADWVFMKSRGIHVLEKDLHHLSWVLHDRLKQGCVQQLRWVFDAVVLPLLSMRTPPKVNVDAGGSSVSIVQRNGELDCRLHMRMVMYRGVPPTLGSVVSVAEGDMHTCVLKEDGEVVCFGAEYAASACNVPPHLGPVVGVAAGMSHTCVLQADGRVVCFGRGCKGCCSVPKDLGPAIAVAAGSKFTCAIKSNGELVCWGRVPQRKPPDLGPVVAVAAGSHHICAVKANGDLVCFGHFGHILSFFRFPRPVPPGLGPVVSVATSDTHTCVIKANGQLACFGRNQWGECDVPDDLGPVVAVAAGDGLTCAVKPNGELVTLGRLREGYGLPAKLGPVAVPSPSPWQHHAGGLVLNPAAIIEEEAAAVSVAQEHSHYAADVPAVRDPELLREQAEHDWADRVVERILTSTLSQHEDPALEAQVKEEQEAAEEEKVWIIPFSSTPKEFVSKLLTGPELKTIREQMAQEGRALVLEGRHHGAKVFVWPHQYARVLQELERRAEPLKASHVVISDSLRHLLEQVQSQLPVRKQCKVQPDAMESFDLPASSSENLAEQSSDATSSEEFADWMEVNRTFLCMTRRYKPSDAVSQSTRDSRKGRNPRCYEVTSDLS